MKIQSKLVLLMFLFVALFAGAFVIEHNIERKRISLLLEEERAEKTLLFDKIIKLQGSLTEMLSIDYSFWDDMVKFLETKDPDWAEQNLQASLDTYNVNALWVYKDDLSLVYSINNIEGIQPQELSLSVEALNRLFADSRFCHFFIRTGQGLIEVYGATIHPTADNERKSPPRGFFFAGRLWDENYLSALMRLTGSSIKVHYEPEKKCTFAVDPEKGKILFANLVSGWDGAPLAGLHLESQSEYVKSFNKTATWTFLLFGGFSLIILAGLGIFLVLWVGRPLRSISTALKNEDARCLDELFGSRNEFGGIARLIASFFTQRRVLKESEERLKQITENAEEWIWEVDNEGLYTYSNSVVKDILGYGPEEIVGKKHFYDFFIPEKREELKKAAFRGFTSKAPFRGFINANLHKDGNIVYLETNGTPVLDDKGDFLGYRGADRDITERKKAEEALRKSEAYFSNALEIARLGPWEYDIDKDLFTFNDYFYAIFRTTAREAGGYTMSSAEYAERFVHPEDRHLVAAETRKAIDSNNPNFTRQIEHRMLYSDGETGYITVRFFIVKDERGKTIKTYGVNQDITERKKVEEALRKNEELLSAELDRFKTVFDLTLGMSSGKSLEENLHFIVDRTKDILRVDISLITLLNKEHTESRVHASVGIRTEAFVQLVIPAGGGLGGLSLRNRKAYAVEDYFAERTILHFNDPVVSAEGVVAVMAAPIQSKDKDLGVLLAFQREKRIFSADELRTLELFGHLATVEIERSQTFKNLKEAQLQLVQTEKMAAIGQLASGVAHEINNPLTGVLNNVQLIKMELENKKDKFSAAEFKELLDIVEESALRCRKITQSLLSFSRAPKEEFHSIDFNEMISQVIVLIEHEMKLENITIERELGEGIPHISGNIQLLQQVIFNFVSNAKWAIEHKPEGRGGTVKIKTGYERDKGCVCAWISDNGIGMSREHQAKIFEPFFTTKPVGEGTGLGLSVAYSIIKEHQGDIQVESAVNKGTTFKLCFPVVNQGR